MRKIRVNTTNSKVLAGTLFITLLKAVMISKSKVLAELIEYDNKSAIGDCSYKFVELDDVLSKVYNER